MKTYYLGTSNARHLEQICTWPEHLLGPRWPGTHDVPLFVSMHALLAYRRLRGDAFPKALTTYAIDSGGYTHVGKYGEWTISPDDFGGAVYRFMDDLGTPPDFVAPQDWMCEAEVLAATGLTVAEHQEYTIDSVLYLRSEFPHAPWIPVLQGYRLDEYLEHNEMYRQAGINLADEPLVGLGSICRRQSSSEITALVTVLHSLGIRLHAFGVSRRGLEKIGHLLTSADSQAWSKTAKEDKIRLSGCVHKGTCQNCLRWALQWRRDTLAVLDKPVQLGLGLGFEV